MESIWISGKTFLEINFYVWFTQRLFSKNSIWRRAKKPRSSTWRRKDEDYSHKWRQTKSRHNSKADICDKAVDYEFYNTGGITAELHGRTAKTANIGIAIRHIPSSTIILGVENSIQNTSHYVFWLSIGCYVVDQRSGDGWFFGRIKILAISLWRGFSKLRDAGCENASALNKIIPNSHFKKKVRLEEQKAPKEDRFQRGRPIAFMIYDYFRVTGAHDTVVDYADLFSVTLRDDNVQELETRWDEVLLSMSKKFHPRIILDSLYKLRIRESDQLKTVLELYDMEFHQKISVPNYQKLKAMVKRSIDQKLRLWWERKGLSGVEGGQGVWPVERKKASVREETVTVSATKPKILRKNQNTLPPHLLTNRITRSKCVEEEKYPAQK